MISVVHTRAEIRAWIPGAVRGVATEMRVRTHLLFNSVIMYSGCLGSKHLVERCSRSVSVWLAEDGGYPVRGGRMEEWMDWKD